MIYAAIARFVSSSCPSIYFIANRASSPVFIYLFIYCSSVSSRLLYIIYICIVCILSLDSLSARHIYDTRAVRHVRIRHLHDICAPIFLLHTCTRRISSISPCHGRNMQTKHSPDFTIDYASSRSLGLIAFWKRW